MNRFSKFVIFAVAVMLLGFVAQPASAQVVTGTIVGTAVDQTGGGVPGATVTATSKQTGAKATETTSDTGAFRFGFLGVGSYDVEISKPGFKKLKLTSVQVDANVEHSLGAVKLELGEQTATVEVTAAAPLIESTQSQVTTAVSGEALATTSGIGENQGMDFLALQVPGVVNSRDNTFSNSNGVGFTVNGIRGRNNDQQIDGQNNNDNSVAGPGLFLSNVDFVNEYQITTNNFGPEYGRNSGSVVNLITKSGTNNWHGTIGGTETNSVLTTLSNTQKAFEGLTKPPQFNDEFAGGTIGGPLWKDKTFIFGGFDEQLIPGNTVDATGDVTPTAAGIGQLEACYGVTSSLQALAAYGPFGIGAGSPIPVGAHTVNPTMTATNPGCAYEVAGVQREYTTPFNEYDWVTKMDFHPSNSDSFFGRFLLQRQIFENIDEGNAVAGYPTSVPSWSESFLMDWSHTFSSRVLNEARISFSRLNVEFGGNSYGNTVPNMAQLPQALTLVNMASGDISFGPPDNLPQGRIVNTYQGQDNFSYTMGRHQLKAGANFTWQKSPNVFLPLINGEWSYTGWDNYAQNIASSVSIANGNPNLAFQEKDTFLYFGDDWKVKDNLTLNLGVTWTLYGQPVNLFNALTVKQQTSSNPFWDPTLPLSVTTFPKIPTVYNAVGPSIGFAWTPKGWGMGNGKTVIRGGYRLSYDPPFYNIYLNISSAAPVVISNTLAPAPVALPAAPFGPAVRAALAPALVLGVQDPRNAASSTVSPNFGPDRVHSWSFGLQREVAKNAVFEARYVGNYGFDLFQSINNNPYVAGWADTPSSLPADVTPCAAPPASIPHGLGRVNCDLGSQRGRTNTGFSHYNGLQAEFRATNLFNQLTLRTGYTWSKTTDNVSEIFSTFGGGNSLAFSQNPLCYTTCDASLSGIDVPQVWTMTFVEDIPFMRSQHGVVGHIVGGWAISGNYIISSGQRYTPTQFYENYFSYNGGNGGGTNDIVFNTHFIGVYDTSRPFVGSNSAPVSQVGIYAGDACNLFGVGCALTADTLISMNAINQTGSATPVSKSQVRVITNGAAADTVFGTAFGNLARNSLADYQQNIANATIFKNFSFWEKATLQFHMTLTNVFNHPNFASVDTFLIDAGNYGEGNGFGIPQLTSGGVRTIYFGLKVIF